MSASQHAVPLRAVGNARIAVLVALPLVSALVAAVLAADSPSGVTRLSLGRAAFRPRDRPGAARHR